METSGNIPYKKGGSKVDIGYHNSLKNQYLAGAMSNYKQSRDNQVILRGTTKGKYW